MAKPVFAVKAAGPIKKSSSPPFQLEEVVDNAGLIIQLAGEVALGKQTFGSFRKSQWKA